MPVFRELGNPDIANFQSLFLLLFESTILQSRMVWEHHITPFLSLLFYNSFLFSYKRFCFGVIYNALDK